MTHVYIDLSRLCLTKFISGIQRVAREIVLRMLRNPSLEVTLLSSMPSNTAWRVLPHDAFTAFYTKGEGTPYGSGKPVILTPRDIESGAVFFDIDSAWNMPMQRAWLFPILKEHGVKTMTVVTSSYHQRWGQVLYNAVSALYEQQYGYAPEIIGNYCYDINPENEVFRNDAKIAVQQLRTILNLPNRRAGSKT